MLANTILSTHLSEQPDTFKLANVFSALNHSPSRHFVIINNFVWDMLSRFNRYTPLKAFIWISLRWLLLLRKRLLRFDKWEKVCSFISVNKLWLKFKSSKFFKFSKSQVFSNWIPLLLRSNSLRFWKLSNHSTLIVVSRFAMRSSRLRFASWRFLNTRSMLSLSVKQLNMHRYVIKSLLIWNRFDRLPSKLYLIFKIFRLGSLLKSIWNVLVDLNVNASRFGKLANKPLRFTVSQ